MRGSLFADCPQLHAQELPADYIANQKAVDDGLLKAISEDLKGYLKQTFSLKNGDRPHLLKF
jgi:large subunit ribosomal protein L6e